MWLTNLWQCADVSFYHDTLAGRIKIENTKDGLEKYQTCFNE